MQHPLPSQASVVIIGGGITGVSTLYHLAHRGVDAVLIERRKLASGTTWHAAGIVGQLRDSTAQTELGKYTARLFQSLQAETGQATGYKQNGTINLALSDQRHEQLLRSHDHAQRMGIPSRMLSAGEVRAQWPDVRTDDVQSGFFVPSNGQVNPLDVTVALSKGAKVQGGQIFENTLAQRLEIRAGKVVGVVTDQGTIRTDKVLIAGGMWSHLFAKAHSITLPLHAAEHFYIVTEPVPDLPTDLPVLNIAEDRIYLKEDAGKLLIGGFEALGKAWGQDGIPDSFEFDELPFDMDHVQDTLSAVYARMPALESIGIRTFFNGPESFTPDGRPYLGPVPEVKGVFVAAGMNSNGILNAGGVGVTMADWLAEGRPARSVGPMLAARAHPFQSNTAYARVRAAESVGFHYGLQWAGRQVHTARGVRRMPLHDRLVSAGACMAERSGWEVPMYYDASGVGWQDAPSLRWKPWSPHVQAECLAARDAAVLLDQSMYAKIMVQGRDAVHALNRVCGAQIDVAVGRSVYTQFLNDKGGIEADVTVTRTGPEAFMVITGHPSQIRDQALIRDHADPGWRFEVFDATSGFGLLSLHGPQSRAILQAVSGDDLSARVFPFGTAREVDLGYARAWVIRRSFLGELGFEILIPTEFTQGISDAIFAAGDPLGLRPMGMFAMNACRIEKGFRHFGHDISEDDTPFDAGSGFAVDMSKAEFVGKAALETLQDRQGGRLRHQIVSVKVPALNGRDGPWLIHNEPIRKAGQIVGHVTSGDFGFRLNAMVGLAALRQSAGISQGWIDEGGFDVQIAGQTYSAVVQQAPFYDPQGHIMRG